MTDAEWQLLISGLTLLLTPIASAVVVGIQLQKSHTWWLKQQQHLQEKERIQRRFDLFERIVRVLARLNTLLLDHQVFVLNRYKNEYLLLHCPKPEQVRKDYADSELKRTMQMVVDQHEKIREKKSEYQQIASIGRLYFGLGFERQIIQVSPSIKQAEQPVVPLTELIQTCNLALQQGKTLDEAIRIVDPVFDQRWEAIGLNSSIAILVDALYQDLMAEKPTIKSDRLG